MNQSLGVDRSNRTAKMKTYSSFIVWFTVATIFVGLAGVAAGKSPDSLSPAEEAVRAEERLLLQEALGNMDPLDREILALRHFEQLSNSETALVLGVSPAAAMARHVRVIKKVGALLEDSRPLFGR